MVKCLRWLAHKVASDNIKKREIGGILSHIKTGKDGHTFKRIGKVNHGIMKWEEWEPLV